MHFIIFIGNTHAAIEHDNVGHVILQDLIMNVDSEPLIINTERIAVVKGKPAKVKIIDFGSELKCEEVLAHLTESKLNKLDTAISNIDCNSCHDLQKKLAEKDETINDLNAKLRSALEKCEKYKKGYDKRQVLMKFIEGQNADDDDGSNQMSIMDSTHQICLDLEVPSVMINKAQYSVLKGITAGGAATRALIEMLFEPEQYENKNFRKMQLEYPEKIKAIQLYVREKYKLEDSKISKAITGKCHGW